MVDLIECRLCRRELQITRVCPKCMGSRVKVGPYRVKCQRAACGWSRKSRIRQVDCLSCSATSWGPSGEESEKATRRRLQQSVARVEELEELIVGVYTVMEEAAEEMCPECQESEWFAGFAQAGAAMREEIRDDQEHDIH